MSGSLRPISVYDLSVREIDRGGPVAPTATGDADALTLSGARHLLLLIHGFNNTAEQALSSYNDMLSSLADVGMSDSRTGPDALVRFQWPGDAAVGPFEWLDAVGYPVDISRAIEAAAVLRQYLVGSLLAISPTVQISIIAHSLGCRLALELIKVRVGENALPINVLALMAPAVPVDLVRQDVAPVFGPRFSLVDTDQRAETTLTFHSWLDMVLGVAFPAGESLAYALGIEPGLFIEAIGFLGDPPGFGRGIGCHDTHGGYWSDKDVARAIAAALNPTKASMTARSDPPDRPLPPMRLIPGREIGDRSLPS